jgi:hypothetical protein
MAWAYASSRRHDQINGGEDEDQACHADQILLWEATRHILLWYFSTLSVVGVVYGSLATTIVR